MPSSVKRVDSGLADYIRNLKAEITVRTGRVPSELEVSRLIPRMLPPVRAVIIVERGRRKRTHRTEADVSILRP